MRIATFIAFGIIQIGLLGQNARLNTKFSTFSFNALGQTGLRDTAVVFPKGSGKVALKRLNYWVTGIELGKDTFSIGCDVFSDRSDWSRGPAHISGTEFIANWPGLWSLRKKEIEAHRKNYQNANYTVPNQISTWPSNMNELGFPKTLAAYVDTDLDRVYNPSNGDFPFLLGEINVLSVATDSFQKGGYKPEPIPLDISSQHFLLDTNSNRVYSRITLCNRGLIDFSAVRFSVILDGQIGNALDDAMLSDSILNMVAIKNGQEVDEVYGKNWPAIGYVLCKGNLGASMYIQKGNSNVFGEASTSAEFFNYAHGMWLEGASLTYGGSGLDGTIPSNYIYSGFSDTQNGKEPWLDNENIGKRTVVASSTNMDIASNECAVLDVCYFVLPNAPSNDSIRAEANRILEEYNGTDFTLGSSIPHKVRTGISTIFATAGALISSREYHLLSPVIYALDGRRISLEKNGIIQMPYSKGIYIMVSSKRKSQRLIIE